MKVSKAFLVLAIAIILAGCCGDNAVFGAFDSGCDPIAAAPPPCQPPMMAAPQDPCQVAAGPESPCGPPPPEAQPGEVWCCVPVQMAAPPPERVCVCEGKIETVQVPAQYEDYTEQKLICPARTEWRQVPCEGSADQCWQLVEIPAQYETINRRRLIREAYTTYSYTPPQYEEIRAAPPAPVYRWVRNDDCVVPENAVSVFTVPSGNDTTDADMPPAGVLPPPAFGTPDDK